jgi:hypothetical protein
MYNRIDHMSLWETSYAMLYCRTGKSIYLRQVALLTIMAQVGSFVPAEYACIRATDQV